MVTVHLIVGLLVVAANFAAFAIGGVSWLRRRPSVVFWYVLRVAQASVVVQVLLGGLLILLGSAAADLHYLYGILPLLVTLLAEGVRAGAAGRELVGLDFESLPPDRQRTLAMAIVRRETGIMSVGAGLTLFLVLRAVETTPFL
ncbi:hypothetical protein HJD18_01185 [Thermoleophilia bacterium SCSIO 60948]|nr:hypothetical protein HJD18_01185 [Thermoleophilia bacterium SCSIO 60948]